MAGIISYGAYIPKFRLKVEDIWDVWPNPVDRPLIIKERRGLSEKAVTRWDEDSITMSVVAAKASLEMAGISGDELSAICFGTCTNPFTSKPGATVIAEALTAKRDLICTDCQFATKSGTTALQMCTALVAAGYAKYGLAIGSDNLSRHVPPNDPLEYSASAGTSALIIGPEKEIAEIENFYSYNTNCPEFFRLDSERYIKHGTGEDGEYLWGYLEHVKAATEGYLNKFNSRPGDFDFVALSQPDGSLPLKLGKEIGLSMEQISPGLIADKVGDCGSASALLSLEAILDQAEAGQRILVISYGFGAGCDVLCVKTTQMVENVKTNKRSYAPVKELMSSKEYITYTEYLRQERKLVQEFV